MRVLVETLPESHFSPGPCMSLPQEAASCPVRCLSNLHQSLSLSWPKDMSLLCGRHWSSSSIRQAVPALMQGIIWGYVKMLRVGRVLFFQRVKVPGAGSWMKSETWLSDHCLYVPQLTYASIYQRTSWLLLTFGNYE